MEIASRFLNKKNTQQQVKIKFMLQIATSSFKYGEPFDVFLSIWVIMDGRSNHLQIISTTMTRGGTIYGLSLAHFPDLFLVKSDTFVTRSDCDVIAAVHRWASHEPFFFEKKRDSRRGREESVFLFYDCEKKRPKKRSTTLFESKDEQQRLRGRWPTVRRVWGHPRPRRNARRGTGRVQLHWDKQKQVERTGTGKSSRGWW